jgi:multiple sugar transport system substrate-binding protein
MRLIRWFVLGVGLLLLVALFAAPARRTKELTARKYPERVPVRFWHMWSAEWKDVVDRIVDRYNTSQDKYEVVALSVPGSAADTKFLLGSIGGDPPDVMAQWNPVIPTWANNNLLTPFEELMTSEEKAAYDRDAYPVVKRICYYKGKTYGIPIGLNLLGAYYLPEHLTAAGYDPDKFPTSLEELAKMSDRLTQRDADGNLKRIGFLPSDFQHTAPLFGGKVYDWKTGQLTFVTPENLRALEFLVGHREKLGYDQVVRFQAGLNTASFAGGWPFIGGAYSVCIDGQWRVEQLGKYAPNLKYRTAPVPAPKGGVPGAGFSNGNFMIVPRSAKEKAGAWDFIKFWSGLTNPERAAEFYTWGGWLPLSDRIAKAPHYQAYIRKYPQFKTFVDAVRSPDIQVAPPVPYQVFINDEIGRNEDLSIRGTVTPKAALEQIDRKVNQERARRRELGYAE